MSLAHAEFAIVLRGIGRSLPELGIGVTVDRHKAVLHAYAQNILCTRLISPSF